jgi:hypothetical protein
MTDDTPLPFDLPSVRRKKLTVDFAGGNQSSNGVVLLLREAERKHGVCLRLAEAMPDHRDPDRVLRRYERPRLQNGIAFITLKPFNSIFHAAALQGAYHSALVAGLTGLLRIAGVIHALFQHAYRDPRMESFQLVTGFACLQAIELHKAAFKGFVFFAERRLAFLDRRCGFVCSPNLSVEAGCGLAELDGLPGLYRLLDRLNRRFERGHYVEKIGHRD